ncbi:MAG: type II secretion system protein [Planctomycetota bacterium]
MAPTRTKAFTFVEVIIALTIVSISLLVLLKLHLLSITMAEAEETTSRAVLLADEKIAEMLALGYPRVQTKSGTVERNSKTFRWRTEVTDLNPLEPAGANIDGLRRIAVDVSWEHGIDRKHLQMSTYVADRKLQ